MRKMQAALAGALLLALGGCGGSGGNQPNAGPMPVPSARLAFSALADDAGRAPSGVVHTRRVEVRNNGEVTARGVVIAVTADAQVLQLPLSCESGGCTPRSDGGLDLAELAPGAAVVLTQRLRIKPGYRGAVRNDWSATASGPVGVWAQDLRAYAADLAVTLGEPDADFVHDVTLSNQGPDDASDVAWTLLSAPGRTLRITGCTATGGATCPGTLADAMTLPRVPASGSLRLRVRSEAGDIGAHVASAGDPDPGNDQASRGPARTEHLAMIDLEGRTYRLSLGLEGQLRATGPGVDYLSRYTIDVTGQGFLGAPDSVTPSWGRGTLNLGGPVRILGLDVGGVRKPYLAPRQPIRQLSELEGFTFNVLGSRADAAGRPGSAYVGSARFKDGALQLCLPDAPLPFEQCPASRLTRFEAGLVGSEVELVSKDRVLRARAASAADGPILISSMRDASTGASEFWIALPNGSGYPFTTYDTLLHESTFESASGQSAATVARLSTRPDVAGVTASLQGLTNLLLVVTQTRTLGVCGLTAQLGTSAQPGLFQGPLQGDWLPGAIQDGQFVKERLCFAGPVHHAQTTRFGAFVGAAGGSLMGRWMFVGER